MRLIGLAAHYRIMHRRTFLCGFTLGTLATQLISEAQQAGKVHRVGVLSSGSSVPDAVSHRWQAFLGRLNDLGRVVGQNLTFEPRSADQRLDRLPGLAAELVQLNVSMILAFGSQAALAAKRATATIPIVMVATDPVGSGLVASLARPGENITGLTYEASLEILSKRLELLKEASSKISRVGILTNRSNTPEARPLDATVPTAQALRLTFLPVDVRGPRDFDGAFAVLIRERVDALTATDSPLNTEHKGPIVSFAAGNRLPTVFGDRVFVVALLRHLLRLAHEEWEVLDVAPRVRLEKEPQGRLRWLTQEEITQLLDACGKSRNKELRAVVVIALKHWSTPERTSWSQLDLRGPEQGRDSVGDHEIGRRREVPLNDDSYRALVNLTQKAEGRVFQTRFIKTAYNNAVTVEAGRRELPHTQAHIRVLGHHARGHAKGASGTSRAFIAGHDDAVRPPRARAPSHGGRPSCGAHQLSQCRNANATISARAFRTVEVASELREVVGSPGWARTSDFLINSQALYRLSYRGVRS